MTKWLENLSDEYKNNAIAVVVIAGALIFVAWDKGCFHYAQPTPAPVVQAVTEQSAVASTDATVSTDTTTESAEGSTH